MLYNKAFAVELSHDYYETANLFKVNEAFDIAPTEECAGLMSSGRMRFIRTGKGFMVFYQAYVDGSNVEQPLVRLDDGAEFVFALYMKPQAMSLLMNVSDFNVNSQTYGIQKLFYLEGDDSATPPASITLDDSLINMVRPPVFSYGFKSDTAYNGDADVIVYSGVTEVLRVNNVPFNPDTQAYSLEIDISGSPKGYYTLVAYESAPTPSSVIHSTDFYNDAILARQNVFGVIKITFADADNLYAADSANPDDYLTFDYLFANRSVKWRYYVAVKSPSDYFSTGHILEIADSSATYTFSYLGSPVQPSPYSLNGLNTVVFTSSAAIPFKETAITTFDLKQTVVSPKTLIYSIQNAIPTGVDTNSAGTAGGPFAEIFIVIDNGG